MPYYKVDYKENLSSKDNEVFVYLSFKNTTFLYGGFENFIKNSLSRLAPKYNIFYNVDPVSRFDIPDNTEVITLLQ